MVSLLRRYISVLGKTGDRYVDVDDCSPYLNMHLTFIICLAEGLVFLRRKLGDEFALNSTFNEPSCLLILARSIFLINRYEL